MYYIYVFMKLSTIALIIQNLKLIAGKQISFEYILFSLKQQVQFSSLFQFIMNI